MISCLPTIAKAVPQIQARELTSVALVEFCLAQIDRCDTALAAWELVDRDGALREAALRDAEVGQGHVRGPLHGIPIGIKDIIDVQGWPTKAGSPTRANHVAQEDAALVSRLRHAGAIILGKTVTTEFACFDPAATRNPWNLNHTPGGSSSGSAVAVAMQMCMTAIGTQTGGSIIRPASYCGVCGFKPTFGHVSLDGVVPVSNHLDHAGPITRTVQDAAMVFLAMARPQALAPMWPNGADEATQDETDNEVAASRLDDLARLLTEDSDPLGALVGLRPLGEYFCEAAEDRVRHSFQTACDRIAPSLDLLPPLPLPVSFAGLHERHRRVMAVDAAAYHRDAFAACPDDFGRNIGTLIAAGLNERAVDYIEAVNARQRFRDDMNDLLGSDSLAITPATTTTAPTLETTGDPGFNSPWSYAGLPAMTIPCGVDDQGLPCGLQIIGPSGSDLRVLRAAGICEQAIRFDQTPPRLPL